jgi:Ca2+-binding RTX toxin-like protein
MTPRRPRGRRREPASAVLVVTAAALMAFAGVALTAANVVASSRADLEARVPAVNEMSPTPCSALVLTSVVVGNNGNAQANLLLGSAAANTMNGAGANDCVVGGGGDDALQGGAGVDVCIGGPGTDTFGGNCETQIQ